MAPLVDIAGLRYRYPDGVHRALESVDLRLDSGMCVVVGPSGGGKSTLLRLLNGLVPHLYGGRIGGRALVDGRNVLRTPTRRLATSVGFVFQDAELQAVHTTVERDIAFGLENLAVDPREMRVRVGEVMERLGIAHLRERAIAGLSGGERQRVAVAGALVLRPRVLVLDEPIAQLDVRGGGALLDLCVALRDSGTLVVVSEHRLDDLLPRADAVVRVASGAVSGPTRIDDIGTDLDSPPQVVRLARAMGWAAAPRSREEIKRLLAGADGRVAPPVPGQRGPDAWRLEGVTVGPGDLLRDVDAGGAAGEVVALMGRNGAGKTTLLRAVAGLTRPRSGTVWRAPGRVAYLPQNPSALLHRQTVGSEVEWTMRARRVRTADHERLDPLLAALGVDTLLERDPRDLSSGERQRAAIAATLCGEPTVALLDEPTRGMDGAAREGLMAAVRTLAAGGASVVVATHDSDLAASIADRVLLVEGGSATDRGAPSSALSGLGNAHATQLGFFFASPGPVTVEEVTARLRATGVPAEAQS